MALLCRIGPSLGIGLLHNPDIVGLGSLGVRVQNSLGMAVLADIVQAMATQLSKEY